MSRRKSSDTTPFDTLRLEGSLFVPELLERAASGEAAFQKEADYAIPKGLKLHDEYGRAFRIATATWQAFAPQMLRADLDAAAVTRAFVIDLLRQCLGYTDLQLCPAPLDASSEPRPANGGEPARREDSVSPSSINLHPSSFRSFPVTAQASGGRLPVIIAPHHLGLDDPDPRFAVIGSGSRKKSAHQLAQEFLNASPNCLWAIVTNGKILRLLRDADTLTRPNFLEFDLETILRDDQHRYADFAALWRILHASRCSGGVSPPSSSSPTSTPADCIWEKWKLEGHAQGLRVRDGLRDGVTQALLILGRGFLTQPDNTGLRQRLNDGTLTTDNYFQQLLRLIYRSLFLFCAEERDLLHPPDAASSKRRVASGEDVDVSSTSSHSPEEANSEWGAACGKDIRGSSSSSHSQFATHHSLSSAAARTAYATGYSLRRLRQRALRQSAHDPHGDLWQSLRIVFRGLAGGQPRLALPALGGLFSETQCPDLDSAAITNRDLLSAMRELRWFFDKKTGKRSAIDYRNMGPEELGSVYESLLELVPTLDLPGRVFGFAGITDAASSSGNARKTTGSYYTPDSLVQELIKSALDPVIADRLDKAGRMANGEWRTEEEKHYAYQLISRLGCLEPGSGPCRQDLRNDAGAATGRTLRPYQSDAPCGGVNPLEHGGGLGTPLSSGSSSSHAPLATHRSLEASFASTPFATRYSLFACEALLRITVCDPSCGSGHFLLAAARRLAEKLAELRAPDGAVRPDDYRHALREVASRCLYGVDINPMAVELCRVALWLETVDPGKPLGFLNHHIRSGNSLLGTTPDLIAAGLPDETFTAIEGDDKPACAELKKRNKAERAGFGPLFAKEENSIREKLRQAATSIEAMDDTQPAALQKKEAAFHTNETAPEYRHAKLLADLWCAAFVIKKCFKGGPDGKGGTGGPPVGKTGVPPVREDSASRLSATETTGGTPVFPYSRDGCPPTDLFGQPVSAAKAPPKPKSSSSSSFDIRHSAFGITTGTLRDFVQGKHLPDELESEVNQLASQYHFFHWHLAFPQVFDHGGFDCILGNPPWDKINLRDDEFFQSTHPRISSAQTKTERKRLIEELRTTDYKSYQSYTYAQRAHDAQSIFFRFSGVFPKTGASRINLYSVFAEVALKRISPHGRLGMVIASGIATDDNNKLLFEDLVISHRLISLWDFENRNGIFPDVDSRYKFCLFCAGGTMIHQDHADLAFYLHDVADLADDNRHFVLAPEDFTRINPKTRTCPIFREKEDAELAKLLYARALPLCQHEVTRDWPGLPKTAFNMANDSGLFLTFDGLAATAAIRDGSSFIGAQEIYLPLYEAKMMWHYDHRWATFINQESNDVALDQKVDSMFFALPRYWLSKAVVDERFSGWKRKWQLGYRRVTCATNERTAVLGIIPYCGAGHTFTLIRDIGPENAALTVAAASSFVFDYACRQKVSGADLTITVFEQLPMVSPNDIGDQWAFIKSRVLELTYTAWDLEPFAQDCGWPGPPFRWDEERRFLLRCELDAAFFHLYLGASGEWGVANGEGASSSAHSPLATHHSPVGASSEQRMPSSEDASSSAHSPLATHHSPVEASSEQRMASSEDASSSSIQNSTSKIQNSSALTRAFPTPRHAVSYIMDTFPIVKRKDLAKHGSYRTKDTILQIYDALGESIATGTPYQTLLNPPPADPACCHPARQPASAS